MFAFFSKLYSQQFKMVKGDARVTYRRRHSYNTRSNKVQKVKTPGGKVVVHYQTKKAKGPACGDCGKRLIGVRTVSSPPATMCMLYFACCGPHAHS